MSEQSRGEKTPTENTVFYHWLSARFPEGLTGAENAIPISIDGNEMEIVILEPDDDRVSFGLFLPDHRYSRKTLFIDSAGQITEDTVGIIPDVDKAENEPDFTSSNEQIVAAVSRTIKDCFPDN